MTPAERTEFDRRRRGRNWAILAALFAMVVTFYLIATTRLMGG